MIIIIGTVRLPVASLDQARAAMRAMIEATRREDGCVSYAFAEDVLDPGLIHISEEWRDRDALKAHGASGHMATWRAAGAALQITDRNLSLYAAGQPEPL